MNPTLRPKDHGFHFPEPSMTSVLIELYFENMNIFFPLLHRPSFDICLAKGLHLRDDGFACVLLLVCAIGCRFSDDPYVTHHPSKKVQYPTGWELFHQVRRLRRRFLPHSIHDLHVYCVGLITVSGRAPYKLTEAFRPVFRTLCNISSCMDTYRNGPAVRSRSWGT